MAVNKLLKTAAALISAAVLFIISFGSAAAEQEYIVASEIEQVYINMPEIRAYFNYIDEAVLKKNDIQAMYDGDTIPCEAITRFSETGDGVDYYVLLDTSTSISEESFAQIKKAVIDFNSSCGTKDRMTLITFGSTVDEVYRSDKEGASLTDVLSGIRATSGSTSLFSALAQTAKLADSNNNDNFRRKACILFTDGYDYAAGKETVDEAMNLLLKYSLPVYTLSAVVSKTDENAKLGELSRDTGGRILIPSEAKSFSDLIMTVKDDIQNSFVLVFNSGSNIVDQQKRTFSVKFISKNVTREKEVWFLKSQKDNTPPAVVRIENDGTEKIKVFFSEDVTDADNPKNYLVTNEQGSDLIIKEAAYEKNSGVYQATLTFESEIIKGKHTVECRNICDNSMQKNPVKDKFEVVLEGVDAPNPFLQFLLSWQGIILAAVVLVATAVLVVVIVISKKKAAAAHAAQQQPVQPVPAPTPVPAPPPAPAPEPVVQNNAVMPRQQVINDLTQQAPKYVVNIKETNSIFMKIELQGGESKEVEMEFDSRLTVGRSQSCDVCIDDKYMARNQFIIEKTQDGYYVSDMNSTNGTSVNGIRITGTRRLQKGDVISAGTVKMTVSWK